MPPAGTNVFPSGIGRGRSHKVNPGGAARSIGTSSDPQCQLSETARMSSLRSRRVCATKANFSVSDRAFHEATRIPGLLLTDDVDENDGEESNGEDEAESGGRNEDETDGDCDRFSVGKFIPLGEPQSFNRCRRSLAGLQIRCSKSVFRSTRVGCSSDDRIE